MRLRDTKTGVEVTVSDEQADRLLTTSRWAKASAPKKAAAKKPSAED